MKKTRTITVNTAFNALSEFKKIPKTATNLKIKITYERTVSNKPLTFTQYLRELGLQGFYIDKRKDHFRIKPFQAYPKAVKTLLCEKISGLKDKRIKASIETLISPYGHNYPQLIIRTTERPSKIILKKVKF